MQSDLLSLDEAINKIKSSFQKISNEDIFLKDALGRCLAKPIISEIDNPKYDVSSMDGYAVNHKDFTKVKEQPRCDNCFNKGEKFLRYLNVKKNLFSENISTFEINQIEDTLRSIKTEDIKNFCINKLNIGEEAYAGTIRYFGKEKIFEEKYFEEILRKFFKSALITYYCFKNVYVQDSDCYLNDF